MSLRHAEAEARSAQLIITKMIIDLDLTDPLERSHWRERAVNDSRTVLVLMALVRARDQD